MPVRGELRGLGSSDLSPDSLDEYWPALDDHFGILIEAEVGPWGAPGSEWFYFTACSPSWLAEATKDAPKGFSWERARLVLSRWDLTIIRRAVDDLCRHTSGEDWTKVATQLSRFMYWEFEDYTE